MSGKAALVGAFVLFLSAPSLRADALAFVSCNPGSSSSLNLAGATGASLACGDSSGLAQGSVEINLSPDLEPSGSVTGALTIPAACYPFITPEYPFGNPECPLPGLLDAPNVGVYFNAAVTATGYTEGLPRPGYLVWTVSDLTYELNAAMPNWALFVIEGPGGPGLSADIGPYSIQQSSLGFCIGDGPDGYWDCHSGFAVPFELGVPFEVRFGFEGRAWASTYPQTVSFGASVFNMQLAFLEADDVVPLEGGPYLIPGPGATSVPAHLVPEPSSLSLLALALGLFVAARRRPAG